MDIELIQPHVEPKPRLRKEVNARALRTYPKQSKVFMKYFIAKLKFLLRLFLSCR